MATDPEVLLGKEGQLARHWPITYRVLRRTYYQAGFVKAQHFGTTDDCAYLLAGLNHMATLVYSYHSQRGYASNHIDQAAATEVEYHWQCQRQFRRTAAALWACWGNLVLERVEKLDAAVKTAPLNGVQVQAGKDFEAMMSRIGGREHGRA